jgi:tRNA (cytidine/uridine-2'-O-)-methyltransferase
MLHVILVHPQIPPNTGNVIRLCANTGAQLHLIEPLGFSLDDTRLRRAGLDYHEWAEVRVHPALEDALTDIPAGRRFALSTRAQRPFYDVQFADGDALIFGSETAGLSPEALSQFDPQQRLRLPMRPTSRSLNLSNAVAVAVFEVWRQLHFAGAV